MKPRILTKVISEEDIIKEVTVKDTVKAIGRSGYISVPRSLVGKYVELNLRVLKDGSKK